MPLFLFRDAFSQKLGVAVTASQSRMTALLTEPLAGKFTKHNCKFVTIKLDVPGKRMVLCNDFKYYVYWVMSHKNR